MADVIRLRTVETVRADPGEILDDARATGYATVLVIGEMEDGALGISSNTNVGTLLVLLERAKFAMVFDEDD